MRAGQADEERALGRVLVRQLPLVEHARDDGVELGGATHLRRVARAPRDGQAEPTRDGSSRRRRWSSTAPS